MPILSVRARNVSQWPSDFWLQGLEKRLDEQDETAEGFVVVDLKDAKKEAWFEVINIKAEGIMPGEETVQSVDVDYDVRPLVWGVPLEAMRGRFELLELKWGEHELMRKPGTV